MYTAIPIHCTLHNTYIIIQCTLHSTYIIVQCTLHNTYIIMHCTLHSTYIVVQCSLYSTQYIYNKTYSVHNTVRIQLKTQYPTLDVVQYVIFKQHIIWLNFRGLKFLCSSFPRLETLFQVIFFHGHFLFWTFILVVIFPEN